VKRRDKVLASALVVGVLGGVTALGVFGLFSATTQNSGNEITTGSVALSDNDAGQAMFNINNAEPGDSWTRCIKVSYSGSLAADVRTYLQSTPGPLTPYLGLKYEKGTQADSTFPDCTGFTPDQGNGTVYEGPISSALFGNWDTGIPIVPGSQSQWNQGDSAVLRVTLSLGADAPNSTQGASTGSATVVWEARNQS
jgi:Camelysin metallo-endopeptidase